MEQKYQLAIGISILILALALFIAVFLNQRKKRKHAEFLGQQKIREEQAKNEMQRQQELIAKYGEEIGLKIIAQSYFEGMTKQQVLEAIRIKPDKVELEEVRNTKKETWIYGHKNTARMFVFENDVLVKFKSK